jgi:hypothetical protein
VISTVAALILATPLAAQRTHLLIVTGLGGEPQFSESFAKQGAALYDVARTQWRVADSSLTWLAEDPARDPRRIGGRASKETVAAALVALSRRVAPGDVVVVALIGHGSGEGPSSRVNLPGADPTAAEYATWIGGFARQMVVFVVAASASGILRIEGPVAWCSPPRARHSNATSRCSARSSCAASRRTRPTPTRTAAPP